MKNQGKVYEILIPKTNDLSKTSFELLRPSSFWIYASILCSIFLGKIGLKIQCAYLVKVVPKNENYVYKPYFMLF